MQNPDLFILTKQAVNCFSLELMKAPVSAYSPIPFRLWSSCLIASQENQEVLPPPLEALAL